MQEDLNEFCAAHLSHYFFNKKQGADYILSAVYFFIYMLYIYPINIWEIQHDKI